MTTATASKKLTLSDFKLPGLLVLYSIVPTLGGIVRFKNMAHGPEATADNARFVHDPTPIIIHVIAATLFCLIGGFQFSAKFRVRWPRWHRRAGRVLAACGLLTALSGMWMTVFYAIPTPHQGRILYWVRLAVGSGMFVSMIIAWQSILRRNVARHEDFMIRAYALGQGAGTQVVVMVPWIAISGQSEGLTRDLLMTLSWAINIVVAELIINKKRVALKTRLERRAELQSLGR